MSLLDKVKEFAESEEVQKGILKVKENTEEILSEENINKCVNRAKEAATTISESDTYKKAKEGISLSLTSKGLDKLSKKLTDTKK
mgnify:CR=1 FL=1